jgi:sulfite exporter TauE/SafE/copper chaperone CopZ/plastocyanin domain-containing protein
MTCIHCQTRIERKLKSTVGVQDAAVNFSTGAAAVTWNASVVTFHEIKAVIEQLDYRVLDGRDGPPLKKIIATVVIIISLYVLLRGLGLSTLSSAFPLAEAGMGYGMLLVIGLITSVHCVAMCGGINLSQCIPFAAAAPQEEQPWKVLLPSILYNGGRVISYTAVGAIAGSIGSVVSIGGRFQGVLQLIAGLIMVIMGINMLDIFPALRRFNLSMPKIFTKKIDGQRGGGKNPLIIGLLNGLMPCGPLQAMQLYALSTGSPAAGGISMFLFSMGTVPLIFGVGALSSMAGKKFTRRAMKVGAVLVTVMGMTMFSYGWGLSGFSLNFTPRAPALKTGAGEEGAFEPIIEDGVQIVNSTLASGSYPAITVQAGVPVRWTITAPQGSINGCNNRMIIREYKIEHRFRPGENVIEFMPEKTGRFSYSCWMGMIRSSITVVEEGRGLAGADDPSLDPVSAGAAIPTDKLVAAEIQSAGQDGFPYQTVSINLRDDGMDPAIVVLQRNMPALLTITNDSLDPGNSRLIFPAYYTQLDLEQGDNLIQLMPAETFDFSTGDNVFYGYVKVVDDLDNVDMEAIKTEAGNFETQIYPDAYFEAAAAGPGGCCAGRPGE